MSEAAVASPTVDGKVVTRGKGINVWCAVKHLTGAFIHLQETAQKLYRDVDRVSAVAVVIESDNALAHLIEAEDHIMNLIALASGVENGEELVKLLREAVDRIRLARQMLVDPLVEFDGKRYSLPLLPLEGDRIDELVRAINDAKDVARIRVERVMGEVGRVKDMLRPITDVVRHEMDRECVVCTEDVVARMVSGLRERYEGGQGLVLKPNPDPVTDLVVIVMMGVFTGLVIATFGTVPTNRMGLMRGGV